MRIVHHLTGVVALATLIGTTGASAENPMITGKRNAVCASQDIMACIDDAVCMQGKPSTFDMPTFMFVDVKTKTIRAVDADGSTVTSPIKTYEVTDQSAIMQGYENHRGWTLAVDKMDGSFTLSATGPDINFMIMGSCTQL
jgi:hypothetical protein